jgi:hypothetical protein
MIFKVLETVADAVIDGMCFESDVPSTRAEEALGRSKHRV